MRRTLRRLLNITHFDLIIVNQYFLPDTAATALRIADICEELGSNWSVAVVCGSPSYNPDKMNGESHSGNVDIVRVPSFRFSRRTWWGRVFNYVSYLVGATIAIGLLRSPKCIIAFTDPPLIGLAALFWAFIKRRPYIQVVQDLHPECAIASGMLKYGFVSRLVEWMTNIYLRRADVVIAIGERMRAYLIASRRVSVDRLEVIHNWPEITSEIYKKDGEIKDGAEFTVIYAGNLGHSQGLGTLIACAKKLEIYPSIRFLVVGDGAARESFCQDIKTYDLTNVTLMSRLPQKEFSSLIRKCDIGLVLMKDGLSGAMLPSKVYTIMAAGIPFLSVGGMDSEVEFLAQKHNAGLVVAHSVENMAEAILWFYEHAREREEMGTNGRLLIDGRYGRQFGLKRYVEVVEEVCNGSCRTARH